MAVPQLAVPRHMAVPQLALPHLVAILPVQQLVLPASRKLQNQLGHTEQMRLGPLQTHTAALHTGTLLVLRTEQMRLGP